MVSGGTYSGIAFNCSVYKLQRRTRISFSTQRNVLLLNIVIYRMTKHACMLRSLVLFKTWAYVGRKDPGSATLLAFYRYAMHSVDVVGERLPNARHSCPGISVSKNSEITTEGQMRFCCKVDLISLTMGKVMRCSCFGFLTYPAIAIFSFHVDAKLASSWKQC